MQIPWRLRVRRPISGLVRDNYPSGRTATYHFIPKQTTAELYMNPDFISRGFGPDFEIFFEIFHLLLPGSPCYFSVFGLCILTRYQVCPNLAKNSVFLPTFFDISGLVACKTYIFPAFAPKIMDTPSGVPIPISCVRLFHSPYCAASSKASHSA